MAVQGPVQRGGLLRGEVAQIERRPGWQWYKDGLSRSDGGRWDRSRDRIAEAEGAAGVEAAGKGLAAWTYRPKEADATGG